MASYAATVLALNPVLFFRMDELSGTVMHDSSSYATHGDFYYGAGNVPGFGLASPIETDPASRAIGGSIGKVTIATAPQAAVGTNFTLEAWGVYAGTSHLITRNGQIGLTGGNWLAIDPGGGGVRFHFYNGTDYELNHLQSVNDIFYHCVGVRNGNVMQLYVNGLLVAQRTDLTAGSMAVSGGAWYFGSAENQNLWKSVATDECAIYGTALTAGQILANYEAALAVLPLSATITVRVAVELATDQIIPVEFPFAHNWADALSGAERPLVEHLVFKTNINQSEPDYQQRINAQPYHVERTIETAVTPVTPQGRSILQSALWTPGSVYPLPIANDWSMLTAQANVAATTLSLDTTLRDYEVGSYVAVWSDVRDPATFQRFLITSVSNTQLGVSPAVATVLPVGSPAMPARLACLPDDALSLESHLIDRDTAPLQFEVLATELSLRRVTAYTPAATYKSVEVFSLERAKVEWVDPVAYQVGRRISATGNPAGNDYQRAVDTGSPQTIPLRVLLTTRQAISSFYGWIMARQGKQNPVWVVGQDNDLQVIAATSSTMTISYIGYAKRYNVHSARRDVVFHLTDGSRAYQRITGAVDNGNGTETLTIAPPAFSTIVKVSFLKFCTAPDLFELAYHRNGNEFICECSFVMTELLTSPA